MAILPEHWPKLLSVAALAALGVGGLSPGSAQTLDRVVASVESSAITQSDAETQYRLELFLDGRDPESPPQPGDLARARDRLVDQRLLLEESDAEGLQSEAFLPLAAETFQDIRARYESEEQFQSVLAAVGLSGTEVVSRLAEMKRALQVIEVRLRPSAWVELQEVETYYRETFVPDFARRGAGEVPTLEAVENAIREILIQRKVDELLEVWLTELKSSRRVQIHSESSATGGPTGEVR